MGYPSKANRAWLRQREIAATISKRDDQISHRRKPGRPIDFGDEQKSPVPRPQSGGTLPQQAEAVARDRDALGQDRSQLPRAIALAATLIWIKTDLVYTIRSSTV
ncbi:hypothetical protein ACFQ58_02005 [Agromyces sp. NPDC056523]|uniref:hypothetical protein n=1 Tax=Agromyces sp. NPDC056523 TaxID=3345850 RepID=UPI00367086E7